MEAILAVVSDLGPPHVTLLFTQNPIPAPRPRARVVRARVPFVRFYNPKDYMEHKQKAADSIGAGDSPLTGPLIAATTFAIAQPGKSSLTHPKPDLDNYLKTPFDAITDATGYWLDDTQVVYSLEHKRWAAKDEQPHTLVEIWRVDEDTRG